jgi:hypothetical protein
MTRINDNGTDREMTVAEKTEFESFVQDDNKRLAAEIAALEAAAAAKVSARVKLAALGLTNDEIAALLGA